MSPLDPNAAAPKDSGIFGMDCTFDEAKLVYVPVPWEATTSYGGGTSKGPNAILDASHQVDLFDLDVLNPYLAGLHLLEESKQIIKWNRSAKEAAQKIIAKSGVIGKSPALRKALAQVNALGEKLNDAVYHETKRVLAEQKIVGIIGGDHSVPFGALQAIGERYPSFGVLHFDAHSDTRIAYEGFTWSHASIMYNVIEKIPQVKKLVQVGIRDFCEQEWDYCQSKRPQIEVHFDSVLAKGKFEGIAWSAQTAEILKNLPKDVWISFDIDGLDPKYCPHTGTPVPGGLEFNEALFMVSYLVRSGRRIIGFDLNEVSPAPNGKNEWDANVGARLLYKLSAWTLASQGLAQMRK